MLTYSDEDDRPDRDREEELMREDMGDEAYESRFLTNPLIKKWEAPATTVEKLEKLNLEVKDKDKDLRRFLDAINAYAESLKKRCHIEEENNNAQ